MADLSDTEGGIVNTENEQRELEDADLEAFNAIIRVLTPLSVDGQKRVLQATAILLQIGGRRG